MGPSLDFVINAIKFYRQEGQIMSASSKSFPLPVQLVLRKNFMLKHCFGAVFFFFLISQNQGDTTSHNQGPFSRESERGPSVQGSWMA